MPVQSVSSVAFKKNEQSQKISASEFVDMNNSDLMLLAEKKSYDKKELKKQSNRLFQLFFAIPIVDTISKGIMKKAPLGEKLATSGKAGFWWGICIGTIGVYSAIKNKIASKSSTVRDFENNNPILSLIADLGIIIPGFFWGAKGISKLKEKFPKQVSKIADNSEKIKKAIDDSSFNKKVFSKIAEKTADLVEKFPKMAKGVHFGLENSVFIILGVAIAVCLGQTANNREKVDDKYKELKDLQLAVAKNLAQKNINAVEEKSN